MLRPVPVTAWLPLSMIMFGIGPKSAFFLVALGAFYPILVNTIFAVRSVEPRLFEAAQMLGVSPARLFPKVVLPASLPGMFTGLRLGLGFAWVVIVVGEMTGVQTGLGAMIMDARQLSRTEIVIAGMAVIGVAGFLSDYVGPDAGPPAAGLEPAAWLIPVVMGQRVKSGGHVVGDRLAVMPQREAAPILRDTSLLMTEPVLRAINAGKIYPGGIEALRNANLTIAPGEFVCLIGASGCGKSTLLRMIAGFETVTSGQIIVRGREVTGPGPDRGMVFQDYGLFPWLTIRKNIAFGPLARGKPKAEAMATADRFVSMMGLDRFADSYPHQLSGGMKQRVAIGRVLANDARMALMDEPFGALDAMTRERLQDELLTIWRATGLSVVFVTHSLEEAIFLADRVVVMSPGPGRIVAEERITLERPRDVSSPAIQRYPPPSGLACCIPTTRGRPLDACADGGGGDGRRPCPCRPGDLDLPTLRRRPSWLMPARLEAEGRGAGRYGACRSR